MTIRLSRGRSTSTPFRLCPRAPRTEMWVRLLGGVCSRFVFDTQGSVSWPETCVVRGPTAMPSTGPSPFVEAIPQLAINHVSVPGQAALWDYPPGGPIVEDGAI